MVSAENTGRLLSGSTCGGSAEWASLRSVIVRAMARSQELLSCASWALGSSLAPVRHCGMQISKT